MPAIFTKIKRQKIPLLVVSGLTIVGFITGVGIALWPKPITIKVVSGQYVKTNEIGGDILALKVKAHNDGRQAVSVTANDFVLTGKDGKKLLAQSLDSDELSRFKETNLARNESKVGYLYFKVKKGNTYKLIATGKNESGHEASSNTANVKSGAYKIPIKAVKLAVQTYLSSVFLNQNEIGFANRLSNDEKMDKAAFTKHAANFLNEDVLLDAGVSDEKLTPMVRSIQTANKIHGKVRMSVSELSPDNATVDVTVHGVDLTAVGEQFYQALLDSVADKSEDELTDDQIEKIISNGVSQMVGKFGDVIAKQDLSDGEVQLNLVKKGGKWQVQTDTSGYEQLSNDFAGEF